MDHLGAFEAATMPPGLTFERKWEFLKPYIERLYIHDKYKLAKVVEILQAQFGFDATEAQYKYQIKKWRLRKNIPTSKKAAMNQKYQHLSTTGMTAVVKYKGQEVDPRKLRRQAKMETRRALRGAGAQATRSDNTPFLSPLTSSAAKLFMTWNLPYKPSKTLMSQIIDHHSPLGQSMSTPSDVSVGTPYANDVASPSNALSPLSSALRKKMSVERAQLFFEGKYQQLLASMSTEEQVTMSTWLYQFWLFSFKTAKYWGQGPRDWFADLLAFGRDGADIFPVPASPHTPSDRVGHSPQGQPSVASGLDNIGVGSKPSLLCRWAIHLKHQSYQGLPNPPLLEHRAIDPADPKTYQPWPEQWMASSYSEKLRNALESNDFSNIPTDQLPAAIPEALKMAKRDPSELSAQSLGFAIMSGNEPMVAQLLDRELDKGIASREIDVFHLATSYLNGSKVCCNLLNTISQFRPLRQHYTNDRGHTVLDNLMIAILKGHTSCTPGQVDNAFKGQVRFFGEEVDICGRWDADSDCIRELLAKGTHRIPFQWKHKFCHTSVQTICHSIMTICGAAYAPDINTHSGLFIKRCMKSHCGLKMQMTPLHTLVLVMWQLSNYGCEGEDLFGAVAVLLCLLRNGSDPCLQSNLSIMSLVGNSPSEDSNNEADPCEHKPLDPLELANAIYSLKCTEWTKKVRLGWQTFSEILLYSQQILLSREVDESAPSEEGDSDFYMCDFCDYSGQKIFRANTGRLGQLWSAINTELVTYRRLHVGDPWLSANINLEGMLESLVKGCPPDFPLVKDNMMNPRCHCGTFGRRYENVLDPTIACAFYFLNMEDWSRSTFLEIPKRDWWDFSSDTYSEGVAETNKEMGDVEDSGITDEIPQDEDIYGVEQTLHNGEWQDDMDTRW